MRIPELGFSTKSDVEAVRIGSAAQECFLTTASFLSRVTPKGCATRPDVAYESETAALPPRSCTLSCTKISEVPIIAME